MSGMDITEFLAKCLDEDEAVAKAATPGPWVVGRPPYWTNIVVPEQGFEWVGTVGERMDARVFTGQTANRGREEWEADAAYIVCHHPPRVLREVAAKRRVLARHSQPGPDETDRLATWFPGHCKGCGYDDYRDGPHIGDINECPELRDMASVYDDRPGYQEGWKPVGAEPTTAPAFDPTEYWATLRKHEQEARDPAAKDRHADMWKAPEEGGEG